MALEADFVEYWLVVSISRRVSRVHLFASCIPLLSIDLWPYLVAPYLVAPYLVAPYLVAPYLVAPYLVM